MGPQAPRSKSRFEARTNGGKRNDSCTLEFFVVAKVSRRRTHEGPRSRSRRRRRSRAFKFPASSASLRSELSPWFKPSAQLHEKGREFDLCEFHGRRSGGGSAPLVKSSVCATWRTCRKPPQAR